MSEVIGFLITLSAFWHVLGFAFGLIYIHFSLKSLLGIIPYDKTWTHIIRSADVHLWLSGFALIGLGIWQKGFDAYLANPKLWCKVTTITALLSSLIFHNAAISSSVNISQSIKMAHPSYPHR